MFGGVYIYLYTLKINMGYITPCDPSAHLSPAPFKRGLTMQSLSLAEICRPAEVVMATRFYLDHYSNCNTAINSLYSVLEIPENIKEIIAHTLRTAVFRRSPTLNCQTEYKVY